MDPSSEVFGPVPRLEPVPCARQPCRRPLFQWITSRRWPVILIGDSEPSRDSANRIFAFLAKHLKP